MVFEPNKILNNIYFRRFVAGAIDFGFEFGGGLLGGYFGAMLAALVIVLNHVTPAMTQTAVWSGMLSGFVFWGVTASWVNRVLVQGMSRATIGKKFMHLEIVSTGAPVTWETMMKHWISATLMGHFDVVSSLDHANVAPVYSIQQKPAAAPAQEVSETSSDKKAA